MKPLTADAIRGSWATLLSVWRADESLDLARIANEIDVLIAMKVSGIYSHGTAGEFHQQSDDEFVAVASLLATRCEAAGMPFQIGVSHMSATQSLARLERIVELAPGAVQVILPDWFPVSDVEAIGFLERMAETANGIGLVLYAPPFAKRTLGVQDVARLSHHVPQLVGIKTAGGDDAWYAAMREHLSHLSVFVPGHLLASGVQRGAAGSYSNVACLHPAAAQAWWEQMHSDMPAALELEGRLRTFMRDHIEPFIASGYANFVCDRFLAQVGGWADVGAVVRWPYLGIPVNAVPRVRERVAATLPEFLPTNVAPSEGNR